MSLYRIMLVDDEEEVRTSIIKKIKWEETGFIVVGDAENGQDALDKIEIYEPDVILTDIKMPYIDGLELARRVKKNYPSIRIVIFSGFDEFEYAKQAIQCKVTEYIVKPVNGEELTQILIQIRNSLDKELEEKRSIKTLRDSYKKNLPLLKEHFFLDMVHGKMDAETIALKLQEYDLQNLIGSNLVIASTEISISTDTVDISHPYNEQDYLTLLVERCLEEKLGGIYEYALFHSSGRIHMIIALNEFQSLLNLMGLLNHACKECKRIHNLDITIGLGEAYPQFEQVKQSYKEAKAALGYQKIMGKGVTIYIKDVEPLNHRKRVEFVTEKDLIAAIKFGGKEDVLQCIQGTFDNMHEQKLHTVEYQLYIVSFVHMIVKLLNETGIDPLHIFESTVDLNDLITSLQDSEDLKKWLLQVCNKISDHIGKDREHTTQNVINSAKLFIEKNYSDALLSVEMLCQHLHITPTYFSTIFKKETGQSYVSYLTQLRMEKAKEFIELSDEKTYVIARKVGYEDPNYFSYVFKKQYGVSPSRFREKRE